MPRRNKKNKKTTIQVNGSPPLIISPGSQNTSQPNNQNRRNRNRRKRRTQRNRRQTTTVPRAPFRATPDSLPPFKYTISAVAGEGGNAPGKWFKAFPLRLKSCIPPSVDVNKFWTDGSVINWPDAITQYTDPTEYATWYEVNFTRYRVRRACISIEIDSTNNNLSGRFYGAHHFVSTTAGGLGYFPGSTTNPGGPLKITDFREIKPAHRLTAAQVFHGNTTLLYYDLRHQTRDASHRNPPPLESHYTLPMNEVATTPAGWFYVYYTGDANTNLAFDVTVEMTIEAIPTQQAAGLMPVPPVRQFLAEAGVQDYARLPQRKRQAKPEAGNVLQDMNENEAMAQFLDFNYSNQVGGNQRVSTNVGNQGVADLF